MVLPGAIDRATRLLVATAQGVVVIDANTMETAAFEAPGTPLTMVTGTAAGPVVATPAAWLEATSVARKANAAVMIGLAHQMLDNTLAYIKQREQYGRAIGSFQAVKHVMADTHVAIVGASAALMAAWSDGTATSADAALVLAVRAQGLAAKHCHQVHGGIAFTVEHGFHQYIRYGQLMSGIVGHPDDLVTSIGHRMAAGRVIPRTPQLK